MILLPLLSLNFLTTGNFLKHSTVGFPYGTLRHCEIKNFWQKIVILPPPSCPQFFLATGYFLKHSTEEFPYRILRHCETKELWQKIVILPPLIHKILATGSLMKHSTERFPYGILQHCRTKTFWQKIVILPRSSHLLPPSHPWNFSIPEISETLTASPRNFFGNKTQKIFDGKTWYSSPSYP